MSWWEKRKNFTEEEATTLFRNLAKEIMATRTDCSYSDEDDRLTVTIDTPQKDYVQVSLTTKYCGRWSASSHRYTIHFYARAISISDKQQPLWTMDSKMLLDKIDVRINQLVKETLDLRKAQQDEETNAKSLKGTMIGTVGKIGVSYLIGRTSSSTVHASVPTEGQEYGRDIEFQFGSDKLFKITHTPDLTPAQFKQVMVILIEARQNGKKTSVDTENSGS